VRRFFRSDGAEDRLIEVGDGWGPLCRFFDRGDRNDDIIGPQIVESAISMLVPSTLIRSGKLLSSRSLRIGLLAGLTRVPGMSRERSRTGLRARGRSEGARRRTW
jgi:hypothetical protein